jgi:hypothetical protein
MGFMRRLRVSRSDPDGSAAAETMGLDAFGAETAAEEPAATPAVSPRARLAIAVLAALVLIEAVPTALWLRARLRPPVAAPPASAAALPAAAVLPLASCEPTPSDAPAATASGASATAATTGLTARTAPTPPGAKPAAAPVAAALPAVERSMLAGSVAVTAPVPMQVLLRGRVVATTEAESFMLPVGNQELEFVNQNVGYRARRTVNVQAGKTASVRLEAPAGTVHINAVPWAEVFMDGQRIGETPIGNLQAPIGSRELVFRHPELGERKATVLVTLKAPARLSMDLRKK